MRRKTRRNEKEGPGPDEAIPNEITVGLSSHGTHPSMLAKEKYCKRPSMRS